MARAAGLDIGNRFAKAVVVERSGHRLVLVGFAVQETPPIPEGQALNLGFVPELLARAGWKREPVAAAMRAGQVTVREMSLPFTEKAQLDQVARFQAENDLPFPLEEAILDYLPTGQDAETTDVMTFAARKTAVGGWLDALGDAGIDLCALGVEPLALAEGMRAMGAAPATPHLFLDLGASCAKVVCMEDGRPVSGRLLRFGAEADEGRYAEKLGRELMRFVALRADRPTPTGITAVGGRATEPVLRLIETAGDHAGFPERRHRGARAGAAGDGSGGVAARPAARGIPIPAERRAGARAAGVSAGGGDGPLRPPRGRDGGAPAQRPAPGRSGRRARAGDLERIVAGGRGGRPIWPTGSAARRRGSNAHAPGRATAAPPRSAR